MASHWEAFSLKTVLLIIHHMSTNTYTEGFLELPVTKALKHVTHRTKEAVHNIAANVKKAISSPVLHIYSMWEWWAEIYAPLCTVSALLLSLIICLQKMDVICLCSASVTITALKTPCFNALRRREYSADMPCVCTHVHVHVNVCEVSQFPFQMSSYLCAGKQQESQRPLFHRCSFGRSEGGVNFRQPYMEVLESPPFRDRATHFFIHLTFSSYHRKADGVVGEARTRTWGRKGG